MDIIAELKNISSTVSYQGYNYKLSSVIEIVILGLLCKMQTLKDIHFWANSKYIKPMLEESFGITKIPCYSHFTVMFGIIDSEHLNEIFMDFFARLIESVSGKTIAIDGKTICSTVNINKFSSPLHIASAFVVENGITIGQLAINSKSNEITAVRELISLLNIEGATIVADALNCQEKTAEIIIKSKADYVLSVKKNQPNLYEDIKEFIDFKQNDLYEIKTNPLDIEYKTEKGHGRIEVRKAFISYEVGWLLDRCKFKSIKSIGAIKTKSETRYYISSKILTANQLLDLTRKEWAIESMHWLLDVAFEEDRTTLCEENAQITLNILRKTVLNILKTYKNKKSSKSSISDIMRGCLHDFDFLLEVLKSVEL